MEREPDDLIKSEVSHLVNEIPEISSVPPDKHVNKGVFEVSEFETEISTFFGKISTK
jgi:hypothetical protein